MTLAQTTDSFKVGAPLLSALDSRGTRAVSTIHPPPVACLKPKTPFDPQTLEHFGK